ncbi:RpiB/LacA/LacB family sugar-phosphate isomerase [Patescibacteria group bacterium]|nr:RpiB/LacA/LacB family sugar-phosphate isomerase [Patescibacteria group bacterium]
MIYIGADYAGYRLKESIKKHLDKSQVSYKDIGTDSDKIINDFPEFIPPVVNKVRESKKNLGILVCGTGLGMAIGANRFKKIQATLVFSPRQAKWSRTHDNSNVLCLSSLSINKKKAGQIVDVWLSTKFQPLARRVRRFKTIDRWRT